MNNLFKVTPRQAKSLVIAALEQNLVPILLGSPGIGKSSIVKSISEDFDLHLIDHRLSTSNETDMNGLPNFINGVATFVPFDIFPITTTPVSKDKKGFLLLLDEIHSAPRSVMAAAYKLLLDRMVGQHHLHPNTFLVGASNLATDKAIVNKPSTAIQSRLIHLELEVSFKEWLEDVAIPNDYDPRIVAFLSDNPNKLMTFDPDHTDYTFACPRTWEFMNKLIQGKEVTPEKMPLYAGTISASIAIEFQQFCEVYGTAPTFQEIMESPLTVPIFKQTNINWSIITSLIAHIDVSTAEKICQYVQRMRSDYRMLFAQMCVQKSKKPNHAGLLNCPPIHSEIRNLANYLI